MLTDKQLEKLAAPIINIFNELELELIQELAARFDKNDKIGGTMEWQLKMLEKMGVFNADCVKTIANYSKKSAEEINKMLKDAALSNFSEAEINQATEAGLLNATFDEVMKSEELAKIIRLSKIDVNNTVRLINTKCLESVNKAYMDTINTAYVETASGLRSYNESINRTLLKMAQSGITGATYKRKNKDGSEKIVNYSLEATVRRDIVTACNSLSNKASIELANNIGYEYVEVSQHLGARVTKKNDYTNHAWWQGKVYKINGSEPGYPNLVETTGYGDIQGLGGVNCRHRTFPFIPGISQPQPLIDYKENKRVFEKEQELRRLERKMRELRRVYAVVRQTGDASQVKKAKQDILLQSEKIDLYCSQNGLKRNENRETVKEFLK